MDHPQDTFFQVSVKGLCFDTEGKLLMIQEPNGLWEVVGGRIQKGEDLVECLKRECIEEIGLECEVLAEQPSIAYSSIDVDNRPRLMVFYPIRIHNLDFKKTDECVDIRFYTLDDIRRLPLVPQLKPLIDFL